MKDEYIKLFLDKYFRYDDNYIHVEAVNASGIIYSEVSTYNKNIKYGLSSDGNMHYWWDMECISKEEYHKAIDEVANYAKSR